jgi:hypothetical protein
MASIDNGMSMMNMDAYWQYCVKGVIRRPCWTAIWESPGLRRLTPLERITADAWA